EWGRQHRTFQVLIDSGADESFIDASLASQLNIPTSPIQTPLVARALNGTLLGKVSHTTSPLSLSLSGNHKESIAFCLIDSPQAPLILGSPWLVKHNPHIDWANNKIIGWTPFCHSQCLRSATSFEPHGSEPPEEFPDLSAVPPDYLDLKAVFSKS
ncbi:hypothetical protein ACEWY4_021581, partial [Coilia grayii]